MEHPPVYSACRRLLKMAVPELSPNSQSRLIAGLYGSRVLPAPRAIEECQLLELCVAMGGGLRLVVIPL